jgi:hypothetical protein
MPLAGINRALLRWDDGRAFDFNLCAGLEKTGDHDQ